MNRKWTSDWRFSIVSHTATWKWKGAKLMSYNLTGKELEIMLTLWDFGEPVGIADLKSQYFQRYDGQELNRNTANAVLNRLAQNGIIDINGFSYSGNALTRMYSPRLTKEEYFAGFFDNEPEKANMILCLAKQIHDPTILKTVKKAFNQIFETNRSLYENQESVKYTNLLDPNFSLEAADQMKRYAAKKVDEPLPVIEKTYAKRVTAAPIITQDERLDPKSRKEWNEKLKPFRRQNNPEPLPANDSEQEKEEQNH